MGNEVRKLLLASLISLIFFISFILALGTSTIDSPVSNSNHSGTLNFSCTTSMENVTSVSLLYNSSGGATPTTNNLSSIINSSLNQSVFENSSVNLSLSSITDSSTYNMTCYAYNGSDEYYSSSANITIDNTPPNVTGFSNTIDNGNYSKTIVVNISVNDSTMGVDSVYFNITNTTDVQINFTKASNVSGNYYNISLNTSFFLDGKYNITVYANDTLLNNINNSERIQVTFDNTFPTLNSTNITGTYYNGSDYFFSPSNQDGLYDSITIIANASELVNWSTPRIYNSSNFAVKTLNKVTGTTSISKSWDGNETASGASKNYADGTYTINTTITDPAGNSNSTQIATNLYADNTGPNISNLNKTPSTSYNNDSVTINATIIDLLLNTTTVWIRGNWNGTFVNYTLSSNGNNNYSYTIDSGNFSNQQIVNYTWYANDTLGNVINSSMQNFTVLNRNPVINIPSTITINESGSTTFNLTSNITDADNDSLTISISSINTTKLNVTISSDNTTLYINTTDNDWYGSGSFIITAIDTNLGSDILGVTVNVISVNDFPTINHSAGTWNQSKDEDTGYWTINLTSFKTDVDSEDNVSNLTFGIITYNTSLINVSINSTTNILNLTTIANEHGTTTLQLNLTDSHNATTNTTMFVNISSVNDKPIINQTIANQSVADNSQLNLNLTNFCNDNNDSNTNLNWTVSNQNTTLWNSILTVNNIIAFSPNSNVGPLLSNKTDTINLSCSDGSTNDSQLVTFTITPFNDAPSQVNDTNRSPTNNSDQTSATNLFTLSWTNSSDSENQTLTYFIFFGNTTSPTQNGTSTISQFNVSNLIANTTYYWLIVANDGVKNSSNSSLFQFTTNFDNIPNITTFSPSASVTISENQTQVFNATLFDSDGNNITYNLTIDGVQNLSSTTTSNNETISFNYTPSFNDSGTYTFNLSIKDSNNNSGVSQAWTITVSNTNRIPIFNTINNYSVNEDSKLTFNLTGSDSDSNTLTYSSNLSSITITKTNNSFANISFTPPNSKVGINRVNFTLSDGTITVSQVITITVNNTNDAPIVSSSSPSSNPTIKNGSSQLFSVSTSDSDSDTLTITWYVDGSSSSTGSSFNLSKTTSKNSEIFNITAIVSDGNATVARAWNLTVANTPVTSNFTGSETTNFSSISNLGSSTNIIIANTKGKISFGSQSLDLSNVFDLDNNVKVINGVVAINTTKYSQLNKSATITLTGLSYSTIPKIFYSNKFTTTASQITSECGFCNITNYTNPTTSSGKVVFTVDHFSSFKIGESGKTIDVTLYDDLDICEDGEQGNLSVSLKDPDSNDEFNPNEEIEIDVKVTNDGDDSKKIVVEAILYNTDEDNDEESDKSDSQKVKEDDSENFDLIIDVPNDFDDTDDFILFVKAYEKSEEDTQCNFDVIDIDLEREKHDVIIDDVTIIPTISSPGKSIEVIVDVENQGSKDEDEVYITITEGSLGISEKSELFDIENFDEDNTFSESFLIKIPENSNEGNYSLDIEVVFDDGSDSKLETISIISTELFRAGEINLISDGIINLGFTKETPKIEEKTTVVTTQENKVIPKSSNVYRTISIILVMGIILLIGLIIWIVRK
jgi:hypothetical protein|tara:strand:- start:2392 stop:7173 length:4782 start_codon:yes stop_codon:yes gene_type:complete